MTVELAILVTALVLGLVVLAVRQRRRGDHPGGGPTDLTPVPVGSDENPPHALVFDGDDGQYIVEVADTLPQGAAPVPQPVASKLGAALGQSVGVQDLAAHMHLGQTFRLVKAPPGGLVNVAGSADRYRGFGVQGDGVTGHGEFKKLRPGGAISPALALTVASAALGAYWQQQMHTTLQGMRRSLQSLQRRLEHDLDAKLDLAEQTLAEHEAALPSGRYEPPASVTDGMQAYRVQREELRDALARVKQYSEEELSDGDYVRDVVEGGASTLEHQLYRAVRGFAIEARVLHLKRIAGLTEPEAYQTELERQRARLGEDLVLLQEVASTARSIRSSSEHDRFRVETPRRRQERRKLERQQAEAHRANLADLESVAGQLMTFGSRPALEQSSVEMYVTFSAVGEATAVLAESQADIADDAVAEVDW